MDDVKKTSVKNRELVNRYPFLRLRNEWNGEETDDYSYTKLDEMPSGWRKAFGEQMCEEIVDELRKDGLIEGYEIIQIKEKWGSLRWYDAGASDNVYKIIHKYEKLSERICIKCGAPATRISRGWIAPFCDSCIEELERSDLSDKIEEENAQNDLP